MSSRIYSIIFTKITNSIYFRNIMTLGSGTILSQLVSIFSAPIVYRIYSKSDYGTLGIFMSITGILSVFSTLQYNQLIIIEKEDKEAIKAIWLNRILNFVISFFLFLLIFFFKKKIGLILNNQEIEYWLFLIPVSIFLSGQSDIYRVWANRKQEYKILTFNTLFTSLLVPFFSISFGLIVKGPHGLFVGLISGQLISYLVLFYSINKKYENFSAGIYIDDLIRKALINQSFAKFSLSTEFIHRFAEQLPVLLISRFSGPATVGVYNLAIRMLGFPVGFISNAVGEVFKQRASSDYNSFGNCRIIFKKTFLFLFIISIFLVGFILLFAKDLFEYYFGNNWIDAGKFSEILVFVFAFQLVVSPLSYMYYVAKKLKENFFIHLYVLCSSSLILYFGFLFNQNSFFVIKLYVINYCFVYLVYLTRSYKFTKFINDK